MTPEARDRLHAAVDELVDALAEAATPRPATEPPALLSINEAAARLSVSRRLLYEAMGRGEIASTRIGARRLIPEAEIARYASVSLNGAATENPTVTAPGGRASADAPTPNRG
jgi:excisionase family DNA binding protein